MARYSNVQTDFSGGLISDYVLGRTDIKRVANSGRTFRNFFPSLQGPAIFRTGFKHYNSTEYPTDDVVSVDVILATDTPYRAVFSPSQIEIFDSEGLSKDIVPTSYSAADIEELRFSSETGELYIAHGRHRPRKLKADLSFISSSLVSSDSYTLLSQEGLELHANVEVQGDDQWSLTDLEFDVEPFLDKEPSSNKFNISQNERYVKLQSDLAPFSVIATDFTDNSNAYSKDWYVEYAVDGTKFLGKAVHAGTTANYTLADPTSSVLYIEPVVSVLDIEDDAAQLYLLDSDEVDEVVSPSVSQALELDGVDEDEIHLRSDTVIFNSGFADSWVRVSDDRRNNNVVVGETRSLTRWVKIKEHIGTEDHPVEFFRGTYDNSVYKNGSVYRIYAGFVAGTLYMAGPDTQGSLKICNAVLQHNGNRTYTFVNTLSTANPHTNTNPSPTTGSYVIGNLSTQKQFDVVSCYNSADGVPKVEEYNASTNTGGSLVVPTTLDVVTATEVANDALMNATSSVFQPTDVGRHILGRMESGNTYMEIVRFNSVTQVIVKLLNAVPRDKRTLAFENGGSFEDVKLGAWYFDNYPRTVAKFEQRRIFGGTYESPNFIYYSRANDETSFQPTQDDGEVLDTDAITYALSNRNAAVRWINAAKDLVIGTTGGIYRIVPNQYQYGISPKTIRMELTEEEPCEQQAETVASSVFYPDQSGTRLMEYKYDQSLNSSSSNDVSKLIYPVFLQDAIAQISYQHTPQPRIWARTVSGKLYCLSYHRQEEFYAWSEQDLGPDAKVLDISVLHRGTGTRLDQVWIIVKRDGATYTEALAETDPVQLTSYPMLDSHIVIDNTLTTYTPFTGSWSGSGIDSQSPGTELNEDTAKYGNGVELDYTVGFTNVADITLKTPIPSGKTVQIASTIISQTGNWKWQFLTSDGSDASPPYFNSNSTNITEDDVITTTADATQLRLRVWNGGTLEISNISVTYEGQETPAANTVDVSSRFGAGDTVAVIEDAVYTGDQTLTDGTVTLQSENATKIIVGLRYSGELQMMFPTWDAQNKPAYAADTARIVSVRPFLINTWNYMVGVGDRFETVRVSTTYGNGGGFTGFDKERPVTGSTFGVDNVPTIKHEEPYPLTVASLTTKTDLN
jgi:hypothetical protein